MQKILKAVCRKKVGSLLKWPKNLYVMGTKIFKIDDEMPEIIDSKVGNPKISVSRN